MRRKRHLKRNRYKKNKTVIISCFILVCLLSIGYGAFQTVISINVNGHIIVDDRCVVGNVFNFTQKNEVQEFKVPCSGTYKLETWGASGGDAQYNTKYYGGYGGYSIGNFSFNVKKKLYIAVGGEGYSSTADSNVCTIINNGQGYNGGGGCGCRKDNNSSAGGGGATHIAMSNGLLYQFENNQSDLIIVAGGGGGAMSHKEAPSWSGNGGHSGGFTGKNARNASTDVYCNAEGATQTMGGIAQNGHLPNGNIHACPSEYNGSFGIAYHYNITEESGVTSGGGSGYYAGASAKHGAGAGGSSYIANLSLTNKSMYCYGCDESLDLTNPNIFTISTIGESNYRDTLNCPNGYDENPVSKCAKKGDGFARITLISKK